MDKKATPAAKFGRNNSVKPQPKPPVIKVTIGRLNTKPPRQPSRKR